MTTQLQRAYGIKAERGPIEKSSGKKDGRPASSADGKKGGKGDPYEGLPKSRLIQDKAPE